MLNSKLYLVSDHGQHESENTAVDDVRFAWGDVISRLNKQYLKFYAAIH